MLGRRSRLSIDCGGATRSAAETYVVAEAASTQFRVRAHVAERFYVTGRHDNGPPGRAEVW